MDTSNPFVGLALRNPAFSLEEAVAIARERFGRGGRPRALGSQQDQNVLLDDDGERAVLKIANPGFGRGSLVLQNAAMRHLAAKPLPFAVPVPLAALDGSDIVSVERDGQAFDVRLVTWIQGQALSDCPYLASAVLVTLGATAAEVAGALSDFDHPDAGRILQWDLRRAADVVAALAPDVADPARRGLAQRSAEAVDRTLQRLGPSLREGVIHGDMADWNVVGVPGRDGRPRVTGVIDFGDLVRSWVAAEAGVLAAGAIMHDAETPIQTVAACLRGFHSVLPLDEDEVEAMHALVLARAASCAVSTDHQTQLVPANEYTAANLELEWRALETYAAVPEAVATAAYRLACGLPARPRGVRNVLARTVAPLAEALDGRLLVPLDLSPLGDDLRFEEPHLPGGALRAVQQAGERGVPVGRYGEARLTAAIRPSATEPATVALGADLFLDAGTPVLAPFAGTVERVEPGALVLRDEAGAWLRLAGLETARPAGASVEVGDPVGHVEEAAADDPLPARLRVQPLLALPDGPIPDAAQPSLARAWLALCPDPSPLLGADVAEAPVDDAGALAARTEAVASPQILYYAEPPQIVRGLRQWLYGADGRAYLDVVNNVAVLGHSHPAVAEAAARGLRILNTNSRFLYPAMARYAARLAALLPDPLEVVFLVSSGSEANDLALRIAKDVTGRSDVLALRGAYHGWTAATHAVSTAPFDNPRADELLPNWVRVVEQPNRYRGRHRGADAGERYADAVRAATTAVWEEGRGLAGFICEPLLGNSGGVELPPGYLAATYDAVREAGGVCIADEVQVGMGRLGERFWAFEREGVVPDIVTIAKPAGNGYPLGAVVTSRAVADAFGRDASWFSSMGGSPTSCEVGLAVLDAIEREGLQENARVVGEHLRAGLRGLVDRHALAGAAHGVGLYLGLELVRDRDTLEAASEEAEAICERLRERGAIVQPTGDLMNVLKIKPPLCLTRADADFLVERIDEALADGW